MIFVAVKKDLNLNTKLCYDEGKFSCWLYRFLLHNPVQMALECSRRTLLALCGEWQSRKRIGTLHIKCYYDRRYHHESWLLLLTVVLAIPIYIFISFNASSLDPIYLYFRLPVTNLFLLSTSRKRGDNYRGRSDSI